MSCQRPAEHYDSAGRRISAIADYALIGNLRTAACVSIDGSIESMCMPYFDSPSVFARIVDANKGGHFFITPTSEFRPKQHYSPNTNILHTKFLSESSVGLVTDLLLPKGANRSGTQDRAALPWLIRKVECTHGTVSYRMECAPAFNYARDAHTAEIAEDDSAEGLAPKTKIVFSSPGLTLDLRHLCVHDGTDAPPKVDIRIETLAHREMPGPAAVADFTLTESQVVYFVLREAPAGPDRGTHWFGARDAIDFDKARAAGITRTQLREAAHLLRPRDNPIMSRALLERMMEDAREYWMTWIERCTYTGRWREAVRRSALTLKMLVFEETGAIVAAPTFSLPEYIGGVRNWDYRYTWIRDTSFTIYAFIRLGFKDEANAFVKFILARLKDCSSDGMYTIHGGRDVPEVELNHLDGHRGSKPVRIGNGAADHLQLDIYGELMDSIYLAQKFCQPLAWDSWVAVRQVVDYVVTMVDKKDLSIWEPRGEVKHYTYSKVMMWVALDRGLRLAEKRSLPCPNRAIWMATRDWLYEEIERRAFNQERGYYGQSYEENDVLDSAQLIMPLVFFSNGADPRFKSTLDQILKSPEKGGLCVNCSIFRYDVTKADDGIGGAEGAFSLCTLWCVEALTRVGEYDRKYLSLAVNMFIEFLGYGNHVNLYSEEISPGGEGLGNTPQAFTHVTLISAAFNLDRTLGR
ncbi:hypothetical protein CspeluHIS016_0104940 [Cutaneotrichosporon spelunceum]|uniref:Glycoside hydrolase family 15 protein n=1 Tax=Cutaneotrichosporon spelunceum TaxID=1672016 RepID=A0AAD3TN41_9TREE|nr:hypothetical protein CspeluHIS016_0104940 [Cutaneotrichosporon spelunceum]